MYKIPLFDVNIDEKEEQAVVATLRSGWLSQGERCLEFEKMFAEKLGVKHALSLTNCTVALHLAMLALDIGVDDEVICPSYSFVASVNCIKYVGAKPVFADITSTTNLNINPAEIEKKITPKTKAIVVVHFAGFPCDMNTIMSLAQKHNLKVIEDSCHGPLSEYEEKKVGTIGDVGCFSFFSNKNISTGEGGMIVTNSDAVADKLKLLRSHGMTSMSYERAKGHSTAYDVVALGYNFRYDDVRASLGIEQLKKLPADLAKRQKIRALYVELLSKIEGIEIPFKDHQGFVTNYVMPIILKDSNFEKRDKVRDALSEKGIQTSVHYPSIHRFSIYDRPDEELPITSYCSDCEITLPMYGNLGKSEVEYICNTLKKLF